MYRFRSIKSLLEKNELENQEIYFATLHQLNDPMEGYKDIFWQGDEIVWENLLIHYLMCFEQICQLLLIAGDTTAIKPTDIPIFKIKTQFPTPEYAKLFEEICSSFFENIPVQSYPKGLAARTTPVRRAELLFYLRTLHPHAINCIFSIYEKHSLIDNNHTLIKDYKVISYELLSLINNADDEHKSVNDSLFLGAEKTMRQLDLITKLEKQSLLTDNRQFIFLDFSEQYLKQLENLLYPEWYTACFMSDCTNSSMWGNYGDKHEGVCLKFKVTLHKNKPSIKLYGINGWGGNKEKSGPTYGDITHQFHKVQYTQTYPEIDFFRSLGRHSIPDLMTNWYLDNNGNKSICASHILSNDAKWRNNYWAQFSKGTVTKLKDWKYENEYRLVLSSMISEFKNTDARKLRYSFQDLDGIVFGINTPEQYKIKIINIIEAKCKLENRGDFKFYQAYYSKQNGRIDNYELSMLKFGE